ncbi:MAG: hypothetical protein FJ299_11465 [Planctomycetes bacterium]|nr:hypothetical protein [Planctomycetota bacterium]
MPLALSDLCEFRGFLLRILALAAPVGWIEAQQTWIVDDTQPAALVTIQSAIDVAQPGDLVLVEAGSYPPFTLSKPLRIVAVGKGSVHVGAGSFVPTRCCTA